MRVLEPGHKQDTDFLRHPEQWLLHFSVRDTGIGIPLDKQDRLFKSFQQVDASTTRHYGGTGLGLAICKRLSELMGGKIWVESDAGKGATFHFTILAARRRRPPPRPPGRRQQPQLAGKRLLVVEDNATNRRIIEHRAEQWGMSGRMRVERSAKRLEAAGRRRRFDAVDPRFAVARHGRPGAGGGNPQASRQAARARCCCSPPSDCADDDARRVRAGISVFVHKPIRPAQLLDAVCRALNVQIQREKKAPADSGRSTRISPAAFHCACCWLTTIPSTRRSA